jgi:hypothetical protein
MTTLTRTAFTLLLFRFVTAGTEMPIKRIVDPGYAKHLHEEAKQQSARLHDAFAGRSFAREAQPILEAAERFTRAMFRLPDAIERRAVSYSENGKDMLLVEWKSPGNGNPLSVLLEDSPWFSRYVLTAPHRDLQSAEALSEFFNALFVLEKFPWTPDPSALVPVPPPSIPAFSCIFLGNASGTRSASIEAATDGRQWIVVVDFAKTLTSAYYPVPPYVGERFPPLRERVGDWSLDRLLDEVGRDNCPDCVHSANRDRILLTELLRRDLPPEKYADLLVNTDARFLPDRAKAGFPAFHDAEREEALPRYLGPALARYASVARSAGRFAEEAVRIAFRSTSACSPALEATALRLLREGLFYDGPLTYASRCSSSEEAARVLEEAPVRPGDGRRKDAVLRDVRERVRRGRK